MSSIEQLQGVVDKIIFQNKDSSFVVGRLKVKEHTEPITICGTLPILFDGQQITVMGTWFSHPKFGKQFQVTSCIIQPPTTIIGITKYLSSGLIKGIGEAYAQKLVNHFGTAILEIIDNTPERLSEVSGIGIKRIEQITESWQQHKHISHIIVFLQEKGISPTYAMKIYKRYGPNTIAIITENPYRLADDMWGVGFKIADRIAQQLGVPYDSLHRIKAALIYQLGQLASDGHLYGNLTKVKENVADLLEIAIEFHGIKHALHSLYDEQKIKLLTFESNHFIGLSSHYYAEWSIATKIKDMLLEKSPFHFDTDMVNTCFLQAETQSSVSLHEIQKNGIFLALRNKVTVITGGPGTGKTTLIKTLLHTLEQAGCRYKLAAPTGRAAKRMAEGTQRAAETIHRLLGFDASTLSFIHNEKQSLKVDFLIIDEASMIDIFLANALMRALPYQAHILFLGDIDQLPSVSPGNFLHDLIASSLIPYVRLTTIFRQATHSLIIVNAHRVNSGEFPLTHIEGAQHDFIMIKENEAENINGHLIQLIKETLPRYYITVSDTMVLVPMHRGIVGTQSLNTLLQNVINPLKHTKQINFGGTNFRINDRVMQIRNNYDKNIYNGDIGFVNDINFTDISMQINFMDRLITYDQADIDELVLAYAITIHKSQGSEYKAVIIPLFMQHFTLLQRNVLYTAITRAKKLCIFIGQTKALGMAIKNNKHISRISFLKQFLMGTLTCR